MGRLAIVLGLTVLPAIAVAIEVLRQQNNTILRDLTPIDARPLPACLDDSVPGARCLPATDFHSQANGLASFRDITWAFGTAGLDGSGRLLVFADSPDARDLVAALLHLTGQAEVWRWPGTVVDLQRAIGHGSGTARAVVRSRFYHAPMRDHLLVLPDEREVLVAQGWQEWHAGSDLPPSHSGAPIFVTADDSRRALSMFTHLLGEGVQDVKVMVDPLEMPEATTTQQRMLTGVALLVGALLLFVLAWSKTEARK